MEKIPVIINQLYQANRCRYLGFSLVLFLFVPIIFRALSYNMVFNEMNELILETIWTLELIPAILIPYNWGLKAGMLTAFLLLFTGLLVEGLLLATGNNVLHLFFHSIITLTSIAVVAVITGLLVDRLHSKQEEINAMSSNMAVIEERKRIGRELHDTLAQILPALRIKLLLAIQELEHNHYQIGVERLKDLSTILDAEIKNIRGTIADFKFSISPDQSICALIGECLEMSQRYYELDIEARMVSQPPDSIDYEVKIQLVRMVQEALANVRKHAGTKKVYLNLFSEQGMLYIIIGDHGCGFHIKQEFPGNYGLASIRERAKSINALLEINSTPGLGTTVKVSVPMKLARGERYGYDSGNGGR